MLLAGRGDNPLHYITTSEPVLNGMWTDDKADGILLGITALTSSAGTDSWNANQECCWPPADGAGVDDDTYIDDTITKVINAGYPVDTHRIFIIGHSAGSAMAFRYACDHPSRVAAIFAQSTFAIRPGTDAACAAGHFSAVHFHGTSDTVLYNNTTNATLAPNVVEYVSVDVDRTSPSRPSTATQHATQNGCSGTLNLTTAGWIDFDSSVGGNETDLYQYSGCPSDGAVEVWKANGTAHVATMTTAGRDAMIAWLKAHPKP